MDRRNFLKFVGTGAAVAAPMIVLPSEIFPFRKFFLPPLRSLKDWFVRGNTVMLDRNGKYTPFIEEAVETIDASYVDAIELESFAHQIPDLIFRADSMYKLLSKHPHFMDTDSRTATGAELMLEGIKTYEVSPLMPTFKNLSRSKYPGRLSVPYERNRLHDKATPENIVRFIDDLEKQS